MPTSAGDHRRLYIKKKRKKKGSKMRISLLLLASASFLILETFKMMHTPLWNAVAVCHRHWVSRSSTWFASYWAPRGPLLMLNTCSSMVNHSRTLCSSIFFQFSEISSVVLFSGRRCAVFFCFFLLWRRNIYRLNDKRLQKTASRCALRILCSFWISKHGSCSDVTHALNFFIMSFCLSCITLQLFYS